MTDVQTYLDRILKSSDGHGDLVALVTSEKEISYGQLSKAIDRLCRELQRIKVTADFVVGVRFNCPFKQAVAYLSLLRLNVCQVHINPKDVPVPSCLRGQAERGVRGLEIVALWSLWSKAEVCTLRLLQDL